MSKRSIRSDTIISIRENKSLLIKKKINPFMNARVNPDKTYEKDRTEWENNTKRV
jgi:hypothetical protein